MRAIFKIKPLFMLCFLGLFASSTARADIATLLSALVLGSAVFNGLDGSSSDLSKSQPSSQLAQSFRALSKSDRRAIQRRLDDLGFYNRTSDGLWGTGTLSALRRYASSKGLSLGINSSSDARRVLSTLRRGSSSSRSRPVDPGNGDTGLSEYRIKNIQLWLSANGYDAGPVDGIFGGQSERAADNYLAARGLSLNSVSLEDLHDMLDGSLDNLLSSANGTTSAFEDYEDLTLDELGLALAQRAYNSNRDFLEEEKALWHWIEQEYPRERYGPGKELANSLTEDFYGGNFDERRSAGSILHRLILANMTNEPLKFSIRDEVILLPINFVPRRGIPIHDLALGEANFLPYDVAFRLVSIKPGKAAARFYNDSGLEIGYLPVDRARASAFEALLVNEADYRFEMMSFISLKKLADGTPTRDGKPMFEAEATFDGFALVVTPLSPGSGETEAVLYEWVSPTSRSSSSQSDYNFTYNNPRISAVNSAF